MMTALRNILATSAACAALLLIGAPPNANAQGQGKGKGAQLYTPAAGAKDLKAVLFNWAWYMGMLRSDQERDLMMTLEYRGKGTVQLGGQPCNVTKYRTSISYQTSGERIQIMEALITNKNEDGGAEIDLEQWISQKKMKASFPLHDKSEQLFLQRNWFVIRILKGWLLEIACVP